MKLLTINELTEKLTNSSLHIERVYGHILSQCDIVYHDDDISHIGLQFNDNNLSILINKEFFETTINEQLAMLQFTAALIKNEVRLNGVDKLSYVWNAAAQVLIFQSIDNILEAGDIQKQFDLPSNLSMDEYYSLLKPLIIERGTIDEDYDYASEISPDEDAVTKNMIRVAESLSNARIERRKEIRDV